jgi:hypothetical protein
MNKRTAIVIAAGVVVAMFAGAFAMSATDRPSVAEASTHHREHRVRTVHRTITVHRTESPAPAVVRTASAPAVAPAPATMASQGGSHEDEGYGDESYEHEIEGGHHGGNAQGSFSSSGEGGGDD